MARINWIPGWASCFSLWKEEIESLLPEHEHIFWTYDELKIFEDQALLDSITTKFYNDIFIGWSLGSLLIFENQQSFAHIKKIICMAPIFEFCEPELGWRPQILDRMIRKLSTNKASVLSQFSQNMGESSKKEAWLAYANEQSVDVLIWGLEKLKRGKITDLSALSSNTHLIFGQSDQIVPAKLVNKFTDTFNFITFSSHDKMEHWPLCPASSQELQLRVNE